MLRKRKWRRILYPTILLQLVSEGALVYSILHLGMLPAKYLIPIFLGLGLLFVFPVLLLISGMGKGPSKGRRVRRVIGIVFAVLISAICIFGAFTIGKVDKTVSDITDSGKKEKLQAIVGVYVLQDDPAVSLRDTVNYTFGIMSGIDDKNTEKALVEIENRCASVISPVSFSSVTILANALYDGKIQAIIMNDSFLSVLEEEEGFEDFSSKIRMIDQVEIYSSKEEEAEEAREVEAKNDEKVLEDENQGKKWVGNSGIEDITNECFIIYLAGADNFNNEVRYDNELSANGRNDVNILMTVNPKTKQILLCHLPRDFYIANPAGDYAMDRLTLCGIYGVKNSQAACAYACKTYVNYYARINFSGFVRLIDAIGGITVNSTEEFSIRNYHFVVGANQLDGEAALHYSRERKSFNDGEIARGGHQMQVLKATIQKISSMKPEMLLNYQEILNSISSFFETDLTNDEISSLVKMQLDKNAKWDIKSINLGGVSMRAETYTNPGTLKFLYEPKSDEIENFRNVVDKMMHDEIITDADLVVTE